MNREHAAETARRILELWPTATAEQVGVAARGLLGDDYTYAETREALGAMYLNGIKFFEWGELRCRVVKRAPQINPLTLPNSIESQAKRRAEERAVMLKCQRDKDDATDFVSSLADFEIASEREAWLTTMRDTPAVREWYAEMFNRNVLPMAFRLWLFERRTGRLVGAA